MTKKEIPAKTVYICDRCGIEGEYPFDLTVTADQAGRDLQGHAVGGTRRTYHYCNSCAPSIREVFTND